MDISFSNITYSSILSTSLAIWTIYKEVNSKKGRLKFDLDEEFVNRPEISQVGRYAVLSIVNLSEKSRTIKKIQIKRYLKKGEVFTLDDKHTAFPIKLDTGEQYKFILFSVEQENKYVSHNYTDLKDDTIAGDEKYITSTYYTPEKVRIVVFDTTGKSYKSKWVNLYQAEILPDTINT
jgi:hypothetical protein